YMIRDLDFSDSPEERMVADAFTAYLSNDTGWDGLSKSAIHLTSDHIIEDHDKKTITIRIGHAYLQTIEIDPNNIMIDDVKEGLLARGDIELSVADYNRIEKELRSRLETKFNTAANGQAADDIAIKMVKEVYEPIVKAVDRRYSVIVEFQ
ncbi:MAG: hypothetical protein IJ955_06200, partial [Oscillospiraceae bacterium]|nr:hypothetical protein [Oscillospiraceae bacterium]